MKPEIKERWTAALRSGEYKQGEDGLHCDTEFCCLGVLCELYRQEHPEAEWSETPFGEIAFLEEEDYLPREVQEWAGLEEENPTVKMSTVNVGKERVITLSWLNDMGHSFKEIADLIEEQL